MRLKLWNIFLHSYFWIHTAVKLLFPATDHMNMRISAAHNQIPVGTNTAHQIATWVWLLSTPKQPAMWHVLSFCSCGWHSWGSQTGKPSGWSSTVAWSRRSPSACSDSRISEEGVQDDATYPGTHCWHPSPGCGGPQVWQRPQRVC